jgi:hypothetical protein
MPRVRRVDFVTGKMQRAALACAALYQKCDELAALPTPE